MSARWIVPGGILAFVLLCLACVLVHARQIEQDLVSRSASSLAAAAVADVQVEFSGRDATLTGTVPSAELRARAERIVAQERGVRAVDNRVDVASVTAPTPPLPGARIQRSLQQALDDALVGEAIEFKTSSALIRAEGRRILDRLVPLLAEHRAAEVEIAGHTDSRGDAAANLELSRQRAAAVRQYLVDRGVDASRLKAVGYGEARPIANNETPEGRRANRRITFEVRERS